MAAEPYPSALRLPRPVATRSGGNRFLSASLSALVLAACPGGVEENRNVPTIDVPPPFEVDTGNDPRAAETQPELTGVLPNDFPSDLPLYLPASLVDFGRTASGRSTVSLLSPHAAGRVQRELEARLRAEGWTAVDTSGDPGSTRKLSKGPRQVVLRVEDARPGTLFVFEY